MDKKLVEKYWKEVRRRTWENAAQKSGAGLLIISSLMVVVVVFGIGGLLLIFGVIQYPVFRDNVVANILTGIGQIFVALLVLVYSYDQSLYEIPPKMYEEVGGFIENPFEINTHPPYAKNPGDYRWASIDIINISPFIISKCYVELNSALDSRGNSVIDMPRNLHWSNGHGAENRSKEIEIFRTPKVCDVAVAIPEHNLILFDTWVGQNLAGTGDYEIVITIHGFWKDSLISSKPYKLVLEYEGANIITIVKEGQAKWQDKNPTPKKYPKLKISNKSFKSDPST